MAGNQLIVAIWGAAGNMGTRACKRLKESRQYDLRYVEVLPAGESALRARGDLPTPPDRAAAEADVVLLAIADKHIPAVSADLVPKMKSGAILMMLDPAAAYAEVLPRRGDIAIFVTHPTHPSVFNDEVGEARFDYFGAGLAKQSIVSALVQGPENAYAIGEAISAAYFSPRRRAGAHPPLLPPAPPRPPRRARPPPPPRTRHERNLRRDVHRRAEGSHG